MDDSIIIYTATWSPEDHISELNNILEGVSVDDVERKLVNYVVENIEPGGWNAVWQAMPAKVSELIDENSSTKPDSFIVEVNHVCMNELEAHVVITEGLKRGFKLRNNSNVYVGKNMKVPLVQLYPLSQQENAHVDITGTADVVEQLRFFYDHIWLPWDVEGDFCFYEECLISKRVKLYQDSISNTIPADVCKELSLIVSEAKTVRLQIDEIKLTDVDDIEGEIQEEDLLKLMKLHKLLDDLRSRYEYIRDPVLRGIAAHHRRLERRSLMESLSSDETASDILLVCSSSSPDEFLSTVTKLPELLKQLPRIGEDAKIKAFPFLQLALDSCKSGDTIVLIPGRYLLSQLGDLAKGGTICGLGGLVEIVGCSSCGDVMLDLNLESVFTLRSVHLLPLENQSAVVIHRGDLVMDDCAIIDCSVGVTLLSDSSVKMVKCIIQSPSSHSLVCRSGSQLTICDTVSNDILKGKVLIEEGVEVLRKYNQDKLEIRLY